MAMAHTILE